MGVSDAANPNDPASNTSTNPNDSGTSLSVNSSNVSISTSTQASGGNTLATIGQGTVIVNNEADSEDLDAINRDTDNITNELYNTDTGMSVDATIDHRLFTEDGREQIKKDFVDSYEFGEDIFNAAQTLNEDDALGLLNFWSALHNNAMGTQLKNDLLSNPENAHILEGLKSGDGDQYAVAIQELGALAQGKFGLELSDINLYDGDATTANGLQDTLLTDVKGGVVVDETNDNYGDIFIDATDDVTKTDMIDTLGHEVLETQTLQQGDTNDDAQEALANAFGEQLADRVNQAAGGDLDSTGGSSFNSSLQNSNAVRAGTEIANTVGNAAVDNRQLYTAEARAILDGAPAYAEANGITEEEARKELVQQALLQVDKTWSEQDHIEENPRAREALAEIAANIGDVSESPMGRELMDVLLDTESSKAFEANDEDTFNNPFINSREVALSEAFYQNEDGLGIYTAYATENGVLPIEIGLVDSGIAAGENIYDGTLALYGAITTDPLGLAGNTVDAIWSDTVDAILNPMDTLFYTDSLGTLSDQQFVAELLGDSDTALQFGADSLTQTLETVGELASLGSGLLVKKGIKETVDAAGEQLDDNIGNGENDFYYSVEGAKIPLNEIPDYVDLTEGRGGHILANHKHGSGKPNKTEFPKNWSDERIIHNVSDIATDPNVELKFDPRGTPFKEAIRDGIKLRVTFFPETHKKSGKISSSYPVEERKNPPKVKTKP